MRLLSFVGINLTNACIEICMEGKFPLNAGAFGEVCCQTTEARKRRSCSVPSPFIACVLHCRTVCRIAVTSRHSAFQQSLIVGLEVFGIRAVVVTPKATVGVFTPKNCTDVLSCKVGPATIHVDNPHTSIKSVSGSHCILGDILGRGHVAARDKVTSRIVDESVGSTTFRIAEQGIGIAGRKRTVLRVKADVEIVESTSLCFFIKSFVEGNHVGIVVACSLEVVVEAIAAEELQQADERLDILIGSIAVLRCHQCHP